MKRTNVNVFSWPPKPSGMLPPIREEERKFRWADLADLADFEAAADSNIANDHESAYNN